MTNMFKRSLVALAIAGASTGAMAADVSSTLKTYATDQFMETMDTILSKNVVITLDDEYKEGDFIMLQFEGDAYLSGLPQNITVGYGSQFDEPTALMDLNGDGDMNDVNKGLTLEYIYDTIHTNGHRVAKYRISNIYGDQDNTTDDTTYGISLDFGRLSFDAAEVVALGGVDFHSFSRMDYDNWPDTTANPDPLDVIDADEIADGMIDTKVLFVMGDQFELVVHEEYEGEIDVWDYRRQFRQSGGTHGDLTSYSYGEFEVVTTPNPDAGNPSADDNAGAWDYVVQVDNTPSNGVVYTLSGDNMFGWIESDPLTGAFGTEAFIFTTGTNTCSYVDHDADELVVACTEVDEPLSIEFDLQGGDPESAQNPKQDGMFAIEATVNWENTDPQYTDGGATDDIDFPEDGTLVLDPTGSSDVGPEFAGEWGVNGSVTHIPYMPYMAAGSTSGTTVDQIIYVTNVYRDPGFDDASDGGSFPDPVGEGETPANNNVDRIIWVDAVREDGTDFRCTNDDLNGVLANYGVTKLGGEILSCLTAQGALTSNAKFSLTVNVADYPTNISVYSAYNVNGNDRGWVQNDSMRTDLDVYDLNDIID